jgi:hypothetical protein
MAKLNQSGLDGEPTVNAQALSYLRRLLRKREFHKGTVREKHENDKLLIDYDKAPQTFDFLNAALRRLGLTPISLYYARSSSGKHWHVVIRIREKLPILGTLFVQLYLRSDAERERNGFIRAYHYKRRDALVQILFERKLN